MEVNKIYNENCLFTMNRMPDNFIDLTVTSPPYDNLRTYNGYSFPFEDIAKELYRVTKVGGCVVWVVGDATVNGSETGTSFRQALYFMDCGFNLHDTMIYRRQGAFPMDASGRYWQDFEYMFILSKGKPKCFNPIKEKSVGKEGGSIHRRKLVENVQGDAKVNRVRSGTKSLSNVWNLATGGTSTTEDKIAFKHPAIFPDKLSNQHIKTWSNEYDLIYDPFMGSGTTAKSSHLLNRNWIGSEISAEYVELANKRLQPYLDQQTLF